MPCRPSEQRTAPAAPSSSIPSLHPPPRSADCIVHHGPLAVGTMWTHRFAVAVRAVFQDSVMDENFVASDHRICRDAHATRHTAIHGRLGMSTPRTTQRLSRAIDRHRTRTRNPQPHSPTSLEIVLPRVRAQHGRVPRVPRTRSHGGGTVCGGVCPSIPSSLVSC